LYFGIKVALLITSVTHQVRTDRRDGEQSRQGEAEDQEFFQCHFGIPFCGLLK
jgi:hypothetical protein